MKEVSEYSVILGDVVRAARAKSGITQSELASAIDAANRTVLNIENGRGNPKLEVLFPLIRALKIDARTIFNPEMLNESSQLYRLRMLIDSCTDEEADTLFSIVESVLRALRSKDSK